MASRAPKRPAPVRAADVRARVERGPREDGRWYWRCWRREDGETIALGAGWWHPHEAERALVQVAASPQAARARPMAATVTELLEYWIGAQEVRPDLSPRTVHVRKAAARHVRAGLGEVLLTAVDRLALERYRDRRLRVPVTVRRRARGQDGEALGWEEVPTGRTSAPRSVHFELLVLRMAWRWGREVGLVTGELPAVTVRVRGHVRGRYTPTPTETAAVMRELDGWARLALLLYAGTGARLDEVASLTWGAVDWTAETLTVHGKMGSRVVPVEPPVLRALRDAGPGDPAARILSCAHSTARAIYDRLEVACRAAGVPRFAPGGLRRAAVVALYRTGDPSIAGAIIGHSPTVAMRHYREVSGDEKAKAMRSARLGHLPDPDGQVIELPAADRRKRR